MCQSVIAGGVGLTCAITKRILHCHWNFGAIDVYEGSTKDHIVAKSGFVVDDPTGLLCKYSGLDGEDKEFVGTEGWLKIINNSGAKSPPVLPDKYLTCELHMSILRNTLVTFARQHFWDNCRYKDDTATPYHPRVVLDLLQQGSITKMEQPARSPECNPINIFRMNWAMQPPLLTTSPRILVSSARPCWIYKCAEIRVEYPQHFVAGMPLRLAAIIAARCGNTQYWPSIHETTPTGSNIQ